jgi:vacuolar-type H+-ATPase subunit I/STV1
MSQPGYDPNQYQQPYPAPPQQYSPAAYPGMHAMGYSPEYAAGKKLQETSLLFGILGLFFFGFVFGPLAIINANKAERAGFPATAGKVLGWISSILSALGVLVSVLLIVGLTVSGTH